MSEAQEAVLKKNSCPRACRDRLTEELVNYDFYLERRGKVPVVGWLSYLNFLPHPVACIQECHRVLKFGGRLVLIFELDTWVRRVVVATNIFQSNQFYYRISEVTRMIEDHGLKVVAQRVVLKLPIEAYRKIPFTKIQRMIDASSLPGAMGTLGYVVAEKRHGDGNPTQVLP